MRLNNRSPAMRTPDPRIHVGNAEQKTPLAGSNLIKPGHDDLCLSTWWESALVEHHGRQAPSARQQPQPQPPQPPQPLQPLQPLPQPLQPLPPQPPQPLQPLQP